MDMTACDKATSLRSKRRPPREVEAARAARPSADVLSTGGKKAMRLFVKGTDSTGAHARAQQPCVTAGSASMAKVKWHPCGSMHVCSRAQVGRGMAR
eukprot:6868875-Pyramimonas_sp.AAC.1